MKINDPASVAGQYSTEKNLEARRALYANAEGDDPREVAFAAVAEVAPRRVLEVGCGPGELAARIRSELGSEVVAIDISPRMVELARGRGVDARVGDVQELAFADGEFDCAVAAWMLFHVPDLERGLAELARVLRPAGRLVAVTNSERHMRELRELAGSAAWEVPFTAENGGDILSRHFRDVERRDAEGWATIDDADVVHGFLASLAAVAPLDVPPFAVPLRARRASAVFVASSP